MLLLVAVAADPVPAPPVPPASADGNATNRAGSMVSVVARVIAIEAYKNAFSASNSTSVFMVRCSGATLAKIGGPVVKAESFKVGMDVFIRGRLETDGSVAASFIGSRAPTLAPRVKSASPTEDKAPSSK